MRVRFVLYSTEDKLQELQAIKDSGFKKSPVNLFVNVAMHIWNISRQEKQCKHEGYKNCADKNKQKAEKAESCCKNGSRCYAKHHQAHENACHRKRDSNHWATYEATSDHCPGKKKANCSVTYIGVIDHASCPGWECGSKVKEHDTCNGGQYECRLCVFTGKKRWVRVSDGYSGTSCATPPPPPPPPPTRRGGRRGGGSG